MKSVTEEIDENLTEETTGVIMTGEIAGMIEEVAVEAETEAAVEEIAVVAEGIEVEEEDRVDELLASSYELNRKYKIKSLAEAANS